MKLDEIINEIEAHARNENHKSAFEVFKILDDNKNKELSFVVDSDWFKHYFVKLENLTHDNEESYNTDHFKREFSIIVSKILYHLKKER
ncbi:MAG: hypothetical protein DWP98_11815 [Bacteroidetes bacterium]|nr:MAG: hypothetical protein DWP98_11755 [Bacteroidota bacterium]KAA3645192.1 MAG: hypothetical protein DWP98_11815 [Bacteroidota bacterium]MBL1144075.1 hypothetical protein [Bacteroidota bacterium]NOG56872.1 hypothetical protein [Bacteroidota bacterium]